VKARGLGAAGLALAVGAAGPGLAQSVKEAAPQPKTAAEQQALAVLADMPRHLSVPREDGRLLRILAESIGATHVVEIGTSTGYSAIWLALALRGTGGRLTTYEIDAGRAATAREHLQRAGLDDLVTVVVGDAHAEVAKLREPIDLLFLDADKAGYLDYLTTLLPLVRPGGLVVAHNMRSPAPDPRFVQAITTSRDLDTVFLNMHAAGLSLSVKKR